MDSMRLRYLLFIRATVLLSVLGYKASAEDSGACNLQGQGVINCTCNGGIVDCSDSMLRGVPEITNISISSIRLNKNTIETIYVSDFEGLDKLSTLDLSSNSILTIDGGAFADLSSLRALLLNGNELEEVGPQHFQGLANLLTLDLSFNSISTIDDGAFADLRSLITLLLRGNELGVLGPQHFLGLANLESSILDNNQRLSIDACLFSEVPSLVTLSLHNTSVDLSSDLVVAPVGCRTSNGEPVFAYTTSLENLSIGYVETSSDASQFMNFLSLSSLTINSFNAKSFGSSNVSTLRKLKELVLREVRVFPKEFLISTSLTSLVVVNSSFSCLPAEALMDLPSLQIFKLLQTDKLVWIDKEALKGAHSLTNITIFSNGLTTLPSGVFDDIGNSTHFPKLSITSNNWDCCRSKWLQKFLSTDPRLNPGNTGDIRCRNPFYGRELNEVDLALCDGKSITHDDSTEMCNPPNPTFEPPAGLFWYYIAAGVALALLVVVNLLLVTALCWACKYSKERARENEEDHSESHENGGQDLDDDDYWGSIQGDYFEPGSTDVRIYDFAPTRKEVMALKAGGSLPVRRSSTADWSYADDLDFGPPQRSSAHYVNEAQQGTETLS